MRSRLAVALLGILISRPVFAQADRLFRPGAPVEFREAEIDRRFDRTRFGRALASGNPDPACQRLLGGMFALLGEAAPRFHKRDENFYLDPALIQALITQLSTPAFPANVYFAEMVRRVRIDGHMPSAWLGVARQTSAYVPLVDLGKLEYLATQPKWVDAFDFTLPVLLERHHIEVAQANSSVADTALERFKDDYADHDIAWGGLTFVDVLPAHPGGAHRKHRGNTPEVSFIGAVAKLELRPPKNNSLEAQYLKPEKPPPTLEFTVRLAPKQYLDLRKLPRGARVLVRGRLFDFNAAVTQFEIRDAELFEDRDFAQGVVLGDPADVARCALARNDLQGTGEQVGGFKHH